MGQKISVAGENFGLWKRDVTTDRSTAHPGKGGTVGGGGNCAADTEVSKNCDDGRNEMTAVPGRTVVRHISPAISSQFSVEMCAASKNCGKNSLPPKRGGEFSVVQTHRC